MVPSAGSARAQLKRGLMSSALILRTISSMRVLLSIVLWRGGPAGARQAGWAKARVARCFRVGKIERRQVYAVYASLTSTQTSLRSLRKLDCDAVPPELGFTRVRYFRVAEVKYIRLRLWQRYLRRFCPPYEPSFSLPWSRSACIIQHATMRLAGGRPNSWATPDGSPLALEPSLR